MGENDDRYVASRVVEGRSYDHVLDQQLRLERKRAGIDQRRARMAAARRRAAGLPDEDRALNPEV